MRKLQIGSICLCLTEHNGGVDFENHDADGFSRDHETS